MTHRSQPAPGSKPTLSTRSTSRRQRRSAEIRERLFRAALNLFAKKGFAETTVEDITEAADVGKGTFFNYFPSKEHILLALDRKSTRLNSSHGYISYAVFCLKKKKTERNPAEM